MPKIKIKRGTNLSSSTDKLLSGELAIDTSTKHLYAGDTDNNGGKEIQSCDDVSVKYAEKVGTKDSHSQIGSATNPVYVADGGTVTPSNASVGSLANPAIIKDGEIQGVAGTYSNQDSSVYLTMGATEDNDGSCYPLYVSGAVNPSDNTKYDIAGIRHTTKYAGGTRVFQNGTSGAADKGHQDAYIYAPSYAPSNGSPDHKVAVYDNEQSGAVWLDDDIGGITSPVYIKDGALKSLDGDYEGSVDYALVEDVMGGSDGYGGEYYPVYVSGTLTASEEKAKINGIKHCPIYAGGSRVKMNGSAANKYVSDPVIYAPSSGGTAGQVLVSNGAGNAPVWENILKKTSVSTGLGDVATFNVTVHGIYYFLLNVGGEYHTIPLIYPHGTPVGTVLESEGGDVVGTVIVEDGVTKLKLSTYVPSAKFTALYRVAEFDS